MGLSDSERMGGVFACVSELSDMADKFAGHFVAAEKFNSLLDSLWPALLSSGKNRGHCFLGGSLDNEYGAEISLITAAFSRVMPDNNEQLKFNYEKQPNHAWKDEFLPRGVDLLLERESNEIALVFKVYRITESFYYFANRYADNFADALKSVCDVVAKIQGACYSEFARNPIYMLAWMSQHILNEIIPWDENDVVTTICRTEHLHHDMSLDEDLKEFIINTFKKIQQGKTLSSQERIEILFAFLGHRFYSEHSHKALYKLVEAHNKKNKTDKISLNRVKELCAKSKKARDEHEKNNKFWRYCHITNTSDNPIYQ